MYNKHITPVQHEKKTKERTFNTDISRYQCTYGDTTKIKCKESIIPGS